MSQPVLDPSSPGRGARRPRAVPRRLAALGVAGLVAGSLAAPAATLAANAAPIAGIDYVSGDEDTQLVGNVLTNDSDPDGNPLSVLSVVQPTEGTLVVTAAGALTFTPPPDYHGSQVTYYDVSDGQGGITLGYIVLQVAPVNDLPTAVDDAATTAEDTPLEIAGATLVANDLDVDADTLTVTGVSGASHGTADVAAGTVTFDPAANWCGAGAGFDYAMSDGHGGADTAHVAVTVTCVNDAPVAGDDTWAVLQDAPATVINVTSNDTDADGDSLTVTGASVAAASGTASVASASSVSFTPASLFVGDAVVSYTVSDGHGGTDTGTLTVQVVKDDEAPVPAAPTVALGTGRVNDAAPVKITWSATDAGAGVASYEVEVKVGSGSWKDAYTGTAKTLAATYPFKAGLTFRVRATDRVGNVSDWATAAARTVYDYQAPGSGSISYAGTWTSVTTATASGTGYRYTTTGGKYAWLRFTGREVLYVAPKTASSGSVSVYVDGKLAGKYSLRSATTAPGRIVFRKSWSTSGTHTIRIVNAQGGKRTSLDAFVVLR